MKILVCEEEGILLTALEFRMRKRGIEVVVAKDGQQAIEQFNQTNFDAVITDLVLPEISGIELIKTIRAKQKRQIPILILAALDYEEEILEAIAAGADDFVTKPFKPRELVVRVNLLTNRK